MNKIRRPKPSKEPSPDDKNSKKKDLTQSEAFEMLQKMKGMNVDLENQLRDLYKQGKESGVNVDNLLRNPAIFPMSEWNTINMEKDKLLAKMNDIVDPMRGKKKKKSISQLTKERKGKTLGSRRNWMPMK